SRGASVKTASAAMQAHLAQDSTTLAYLWKLTRVDGTVLTFTTHDETIIYPPPIMPSGADRAQILANANAVPVAPTLSGGSGATGLRVYVTYVSQVVVDGAPVPNLYTESLASAATVGNHNPLVQSPLPPTSPAVATGYNIYSESDTTGIQLQTLTPI